METSTYSQFKQSDIEWLGRIPSHWKILPVKRFFRLVADPAPDDNDHELLSIYTDIGVKPRKELEARGNRASSTDGYWIVNRGDLIVNKLLAWMGAIGMSEYDGVTSPAYDILRKTRPLAPKFFHYLFRCGICFTEFRKHSRGIMDMRLRLYFEDLGKLCMPFPPLEEQQAIVNFLDVETSKIDALVAEQRRLIELLSEKRQAVISHAVTKGLDPNVRMKPSGIEWLGDVPEHWEEFPLKVLFSLKHGYAFDGSGFDDAGENVLMTPGNFHESGGFRPKTPEKYYVGNDIPSEFVLHTGEMLVAMTEQAPGLLGSALFVPGGATYLHNQRLGKVERLRRELIDEQFLYHFFNSSRYRAEVSVTSTGAKVRHTSPQKMLSVKAWIPPLSEQDIIARYIDSALATIDKLQAENDVAISLLQERRTALISAAVTGKIDVREFACQETT